MYQVCLKSGRGIRFAELTPLERDKVLADAAKLVGKEATMLELRGLEHRLGVKAMLKAYTEQSGLTDDDLIKPETKWKKVTIQELDDKYDSIFSAKDHAVLAALYVRYHDVTSEEVDKIVGKALPVSEG